MKISNPANYTNFIGIDISKSKLDYAVLQDGKLMAHGIVANNESGAKAMFEIVQKILGYDNCTSLFCMEATGIYSYKLISFLESQKLTIVVEHPVKIKNASSAFKNKTDRLDAVMIAEYACRFVDQLRVWEPKREVMHQIENLFSLRNKLVMLQQKLKVPFTEREIFLGSDNLKIQNIYTDQILEVFKTEIKGIEKAIRQLIKVDKRIKRQMSIMMSIPGIGVITALQILLVTNEFKDFTCPKKFASYAGVAPLLIESGGRSLKRRTSKKNNGKIKALLTTSALNAIRSYPSFKSYFDKKTKEEKKHGMSVINAIRYKLILRIFCCINNDRMYEKGYNRKGNLKTVDQD